MLNFSKFIVALSVLALAVFAGCSHATDNTNPTNSTTVQTSLTGIITDEASKPIAGASVSAYGKKVNTDANGNFLITGVNVPTDRCFILVTKSGYFNSSRAEAPKANGMTELRLSLMTNGVTKTVQSSVGGKVNFNGAIVDFPSNGFVTKSGGAVYSGAVSVSAKYVNPTDKNFWNYFDGDFTAERTDGSRTELYSYGVLRVEIKGVGGEELQLATGKTATLTYPIPASMLATAPSSMPLWYFNETKGLWVEEGTATISGSTYTGTVSHFTSWNCDYPGQTGTIKGKVTCGEFGAVPGLVVRIGERKVITDQDGNYTRRVPIGISFYVSVDAADNFGVKADSILMSSFTAGETRTQDITVSPCPTYLSGTIVDCNNSAIGGVIQLTWSNGSNYVITQNGAFRIMVPAATAINVDAFSIQGAQANQVQVSAITAGTNYNMGTIQCCSQNMVSYLDITPPNSVQNNCVALSPDGSIVAVGGGSTIRFYNGQTGSLIGSVAADSSVSSLQFSQDGSKLLSYGYYSAKVWNVSSRSQIQSWNLTSLNGAFFTPSGDSILVTSNSVNKVSLYSVSSGSLLKQYSISSSKGAMTYPLLRAVRPNGTQFVVSAYQNSSTDSSAKIVVWNIANDARDLEYAVTLGTYPSGVSKDGSILSANKYEANQRNTTVFYNINSGDLICTFSGVNGNSGTTSEGSFIAPDNTMFVTQIYGTGSYMLPSLYNIQSTASLYKLLPTISMQTFFNRYSYSGDSKYLAGLSSGKDQSGGTGTVRIWHIKN